MGTSGWLRPHQVEKDDHVEKDYPSPFFPSLQMVPPLTTVLQPFPSNMPTTTPECLCVCSQTQTKCQLRLPSIPFQRVTAVYLVQQQLFCDPCRFGNGCQNQRVSQKVWIPHKILVVVVYIHMHSYIIPEDNSDMWRWFRPQQMLFRVFFCSHCADPHRRWALPPRHMNHVTLHDVIFHDVYVTHCPWWR